ncbi:MAG: radical SAM protein [Candidatus Amulumruptor caecigallinarius]|nr:radical SAM protein [Candidatus Amulumruptor caecigallinarius]
MNTVIFHSTIFGPIHSRRLGVSLGVNLMPADGKICSFDCLYCEAGYNAQGPGKAGIPSVQSVVQDLEKKLSDMKSKNEPLDVITFSGNGEPTLHPEFPRVVDEVIRLRNKYYPEAKISVLSNSTRIFDPQVVSALKRVDNNILKLDSAIESTMQLIDRPNSPGFSVKKVVEALKQFEGQAIIQTMMLRGEHNGVGIDNTTPEETDALIAAYKEIKPREVMLYSIDRATPEEHLQKVSHEELMKIAGKVRDAGINVMSF